LVCSDGVPTTKKAIGNTKKQSKTSHRPSKRTCFFTSKQKRNRDPLVRLYDNSDNTLRVIIITMPKTIDGGPWDYLPVLNACIQIMLTILIGAVAGRFKALEADVFVPQAVAFVFKVRSSSCIMSLALFAR